MGILKVGAGAAASVLEDSWREYFYCPSLEADVLAKKGENRRSGRSRNTKGSENLISNGSLIAVNEGQCMMIVDQGQIVEFCSEPGEYVYDQSAEPSIFYGGLKKGILDSFRQFGKRFTMGGDTGRDQRIYYFNMKEIVGNKYGTANPVPFRVVDANIGLDMDISIRCHGEYAYRIVDPILFYKNVCGNVEEEYRRDEIDSQLKSELLTALQPAFGKISSMGIRYSALPSHADDLADALNEVLSEQWDGHYGIAVSSVGINSVTASPEDEAMIKELQRSAVFRNPGMAAARLTDAQARAMEEAAKNPNAGPMMAFAGMNMASRAGGADAAALFAMNQAMGQAGNQPGTAPMGQPGTPAGTAPMGQAAAPAANQPGTWTCACGSVNTGNFCPQCGKPKPAGGAWVCACGAENTGNFCTQCGKPRP